MVKAVRHLHPYLYEPPFCLNKHHASMAWLCRRKEPSGQIARWLEVLSKLAYKLYHQAGTKHGNADGLSCQPCWHCKQCANIKQWDGGTSWAELQEPPDIKTVAQTSHTLNNNNSASTQRPIPRHNLLGHGTKNDIAEESLETGSTRFRQLNQIRPMD